MNRAVSTYAPLAFNVDESLTYRIYNNAGSTHVLFDAAGTLDLYPGSALVPLGAQAELAPTARTAGPTAGGRTVPGASTFVDGRRGSTSRARLSRRLSGWPRVGTTRSSPPSVVPGTARR